MNAPTRLGPKLRAIADLVNDRPREQVFQVRRVFVDPEVYEAEMRHVFEATPIFVGLERQIRAPHDLVTTTLAATLSG